MPQKAGYGFLVTSALILSLIGTALVLPLAALNPAVNVNVFWRKQFIGSFLSLICITGILAVFFPERCTKTIHRRERGEILTYKAKSSGFYGVSIHFRGHHPDCGKFAAHLIHVRNREFCAACTGLLLGALIVLAGTTIYFFMECNFLGQFSLFAVFAGQVGVALGFFQFKFWGFTRSSLNAFFVVACFLILAGVDNLTENVLYDLYLICLVIFWLFTRILLSQWDHLRICRECSVACQLKKG